jgi:hypothetical protein
MPIGPRIAIIGAGSLRAAAPVLATLFALPPDPFDRLTLCDTHAEKLDLFDRLARTFASSVEGPISMTATADMDQALDAADSVILCFGLGNRREEFDGKLHEIPQDERNGAAPLLRARILNETFKRLNPLLLQGEQLVFNLVRPATLTALLLDATAFHIDWPPPIDRQNEYMAAHRALRWVRGDVPAFEPLKEYKVTPLTTAMLDSRPAPENLYDPSAIRRWDETLAKLNS